VTELSRHQGALSRGTPSEADLQGERLDECVDRSSVQGNCCPLRAIPASTDILKGILGVRDADRSELDSHLLHKLV
jgi:hypothetical protein